MGFSYYDITTLPRLYDIVWCRFPLTEVPDQPGPKLRPALVRGTLLDRATMRGAVRVSYGTTKLDWFSMRHDDLIIQNNQVLKQFGLPKATRFDLGRMNALPWCQEFFCPATPSGSIKLGRLDDDWIQRLRLRLKRRGFLK